MTELMPSGYSIAFPHNHSKFSDGMVTPSELISAAAQVQEALEVPVIVAATDHDTIKGLSSSQNSACHFGIQLISGEEVSVGSFPYKHVIALFEGEPPHPIKNTKTPEATFDEIKDMGGTVIVAHPTAFGGLGSLTGKEIENVQNNELIDGLEVYSGTYDRRGKVKPVLDLLKQKRAVSEIAASDSHFGIKDLMTNFTLFEGKTVKDFLDAVKNGTTIPMKGFPHTVTTIDRITQNIRSNIYLNYRRIIQNL